MKNKFLSILVGSLAVVLNSAYADDNNYTVTTDGSTTVNGQTVVSNSGSTNQGESPPTAGTVAKEAVRNATKSTTLTQPTTKPTELDIKHSGEVTVFDQTGNGNPDTTLTQKSQTKIEKGSVSHSNSASTTEVIKASPEQTTTDKKYSFDGETAVKANGNDTLSIERQKTRTASVTTSTGTNEKQYTSNATTTLTTNGSGGIGSVTRDSSGSATGKGITWDGTTKIEDGTIEHSGVHSGFAATSKVDTQISTKTDGKHDGSTLSTLAANSSDTNVSTTTISNDSIKHTNSNGGQAVITNGEIEHVNAYGGQATITNGEIKHVNANGGQATITSGEIEHINAVGDQAKIQKGQVIYYNPNTGMKTTVDAIDPGASGTSVEITQKNTVTGTTTTTEKAINDPTAKPTKK